MKQLLVNAIVRVRLTPSNLPPVRRISKSWLDWSPLEPPPGRSPSPPCPPECGQTVIITSNQATYNELENDDVNCAMGVSGQNEVARF